MVARSAAVGIVWLLDRGTYCFLARRRLTMLSKLKVGLLTATASAAVWVLGGCIGFDGDMLNRLIQNVVIANIFD